MFIGGRFWLATLAAEKTASDVFFPYKSAAKSRVRNSHFFEILCWWRATLKVISTMSVGFDHIDIKVNAQSQWVSDTVVSHCSEHSIDPHRSVNGEAL